MEQKKKPTVFKITVIIVLIVQLIATGAIASYLISEHKDSIISSKLEYSSKMYGKYVLYIGTNDKDTYTQLISLEDAKAKVNLICSKYVEGYTVFEAAGGWTDQNGTLIDEKTLIYNINGVEEADVIAIMDEVLKELNQNSIMLERQDLTYCYYNGN